MGMTWLLGEGGEECTLVVSKVHLADIFAGARSRLHFDSGR